MNFKNDENILKALKEKIPDNILVTEESFYLDGNQLIVINPILSTQFR